MQIVASGILGKAEPGTARANLTFPSVTALADGSLLATLRAGDEKDSPKERIAFYRSTDNGLSWSAPSYPFEPPHVRGAGGTLKLCYVTELGPKRLLAAAMWVDRTTYPGKPLFNAETEGCLPMVILLANSEDNGGSWTAWREVPMPDEIGPASLTSPIMRLRDGLLAMSIETNKSYLDASKWLQRRISGDGGMSWSAPEDIGFADQAARPAVLPDGRVVLAWVDRFGAQSIRARVAASLDAPFAAASEVEVYAHARAQAASSDTGDMLASMDVWSFGLPSATALPDGDVLVVYYAGEAQALDVRWAKLKV